MEPRSLIPVFDGQWRGRRMMARELREAVENVYRLGTLLADDAKFAITIRESLGSTPEAKRVYVRSVFAFVEGMTHAFKRFAVAVHDHGGPLFSEAEVSLLRGVSYELKDTGEAASKQRFVRFAPNVRLAIRAFALASGYDGRLDYSTAGWQALREAARVRNRITHPRTPADLDVSDADLEAVTWVFGGFSLRRARS